MNSDGKKITALEEAAHRYHHARAQLNEAKDALDVALRDAAGTGILSEHKLAQLSGVNRMTVRRAVGKPVA